MVPRFRMGELMDNATRFNQSLHEEPPTVTRDGSPLVKTGHPLAIDHGLMTAEEEKRVDEKGQHIVGPKSMTYSAARTNLFLWVFSLTDPAVKFSPVMLTTPGSWVHCSDLLSLGVTRGKPLLTASGIGASIELPADLGEDARKQQYLAEWICATYQEIQAQDPRLPKPGPEVYKQLTDDVETTLRQLKL